MFIDNLSYSYLKDSKIINSFSFDFSQENIFLISGRNGSGKTTLLRIMSGLLTDYTGQLIKHNKKIISNIDFIGFDGNLSVRENLALFSKNTKFDIGLAKEISRKLDYTYPFSTKFKKLSSGNQYKVRYLLMFLLDSDFLIFDEPLNYLDESSKKGFFNLLNEEVARGKTIVIASHNLNEFSTGLLNYINIELP